VAGSTWQVRLERRTSTTVDRFPLGDEAAEWVCGAKLGQVTEPALGKGNCLGAASSLDFDHRRLPELFGPITEVAALKQSWTWRIGRVVTGPLGAIRRML
jgi:hypothetical protein